LKPIVLDASVAAKWLLPSPHEPFQDEALALLRAYTDGKFRILVPDIFWAEVASFLWKAVRLGRCTPGDARSALQEIKRYDFPTVASLPLLDSAFDIASLCDRSIYDSLYVALASGANAEFITADEKLANALAARYPVKLLSAL
jgi:predicted nucleic acid-binding protein